jgi:hypothetical protein
VPFGIQISGSGGRRGSDTCGPLFAEEDFVGRPISDFYNVERFHGDVHGLFASSTTTTLMMQRDGSDVYYEVTSVLSPERIVLTARDATQTVRYNTLIAEERGKSDALLASILPPSLVKRVQDGEKNISFAVQSASISFIDIVEFTPWCGSLRSRSSGDQCDAADGAPRSADVGSHLAGDL